MWGGGRRKIEQELKLIIPSQLQVICITPASLCEGGGRRKNKVITSKHKVNGHYFHNSSCICERSCKYFHNSSCICVGGGRNNSISLVIVKESVINSDVHKVFTRKVS